MNSASVGFHCPTCVAEARSTTRRPSRSRGAFLAVRRVGVVTAVLIALNVAMFLVTVVAAQSLFNNSGSQLFFDLALIPSEVDRFGEWWRLITSAFLHFGLLHIALNMLNLYILGPDLEGYFGKLRFLGLYVGAALGGSVAVDLFAGNVLSAGASGAVFGLMGAAIVVLLHRRANVQSLLVVVVINLILSTLPGISLLAHVGGLVTGAVIAAAYVFIPRRLVGVQVAAVALVYLVLAGLVVFRMQAVL